jgi:citrate lyase subunit beta/citryl-CoA lyase
MQMIRPRRSVLFVPGAHARALDKARDLACDAVVLDLEDSVAPEMKAAARDAVCAAIATFGAREVVVRINPLSSPWGADDLAAVRAAKPDAVMLPKVWGAGDVAAVRGLPVWAMIETAAAVLNLPEIAASGAAALALGTNDLLKEMQAHALPDRRNLWPVLTGAVLAARAHGLAVLDGTYNDLEDGEGFAAACVQGRAFGFDGKTLIHPGQIETANRIFAPQPEEIAEARRILAAFAQAENRDKGAIRLGGRMVERLHAEAAARLLALADALARP